MAKEIITELEKSHSALHQTLSAFHQEQMDIVPFKDSWTAGQVTEHIIKFSAGAGHFLAENTEQTQRPPGEKIETLKSIFLDFNTKMKSPDFIVPTQTSHNKEAQVKELNMIRNELLQAATTLDLSYTCLGFEMPGLGMLTRLEWLYFNSFHVQRHTWQLNNILRALGNKVA